MTTREAVRHEERVARERVRQAQRLARHASQRRRDSITAAIRETGAAFRTCRCPLHAGMSDDELRALGAGCTAPQFVCPRLDAVRRRVGA